MDHRRHRHQGAGSSASRQGPIVGQRHGICSLLTGCILCSLASEAQADPYVEFFEWLPVIEYDDGVRVRSSSGTRGINSSGFVTGVGGRDSFLWDGTSLEILVSGSDDVISSGFRINSAGQVAGTTRSGCFGCPHPETPVWVRDDDLRSLGKVEPPGVDHDYVVTGLNDASVAVGTAGRINNFADRTAWLAPPGGTIQPVPFPDGVDPAGSPEWAFNGIAINNSGDLVLSGSVRDSETGVRSNWRYLVAAEGALLPLPNDYGVGLRVNNQFQVLFSDSVVYEIGIQAALSLYESDYVGPSTYLRPASERRGIRVSDLSNSGLVVGSVDLNRYEGMSSFWNPDFGNPSGAFVWQDDVVYHLEALVAASPFAAELGEGYLDVATGVADGGWIAGGGRAPGDTSDIIGRGFRLKLSDDYRWEEAADGLFSDGDAWRGNVAPRGASRALFDVPGAYTVTFDEAAEHFSTAVLVGDVSFALDGNTYDLQSLSVQSADGLPVYVRVLGKLDFDFGISPLPLPDGRLTIEDAFIGPRGTLANAGTLLVGDVFLADFETPATRDGTDVDLHVVDRLRIVTGGTVTGSALQYGAIVDGEGDTGRVEIHGIDASMDFFRIDVGGVNGGLIDVTGGGLLKSNTTLAIGAEGDEAAQVRVSGFGVDFDGTIVKSAVEASLISLGDVDLVRIGERTGALRVENRGRVSADDIHVGVSAGTRGELDIRGEGTRLGGLVTSHALLEVGYGGEGRMVIRDGAQVFANTTIGGFRSPPGDFDFDVTLLPEIGEGAVFITGQGAGTPDAFNTLLDSPLLLVGDTGLGELVISDGARVLTNRILLGQYATGEGSVTVQGEGSRLELRFAGADDDDDFGIVFPELWVGRLGKGELRVLDGGSVFVDPFNAGVIHVEDGRIEIRNGGFISSGAVNIGPDAVVVGDAGSWDVAEGYTIVNGGRFEIGASPGRFLIDGDLTLLDTSFLEIEFAGLAPTQFDILDVTGNLRLGGTLALSFIDDFVPQPDDVFSFLNVGGLIEGSFDQVLIYNLALGLDYDIAWRDGQLQMRMQGTNGVAPIPIPPAGWLLMSACGLLAAFRRPSVRKHGRV